MGGNYEWLDLPDRFDCGHTFHSVVFGPPLNTACGERKFPVAISEHTEVVPVATATSFLQWSPVIAGALVASAVSLILIAFGSALGLGIVSSSPTWRDTSSALTLVSGLYLLLAALVSFGTGGYVAGRLRERWDPSAHDQVVEFRDGIHGIVAWALAVVITGIVAATAVAGLASKAVPSTTSSSATAGEPLIAYELDRLFRGDRRPIEGDISYSRAEAGRILLAATGRHGITPNDRAYLVQLVVARTGIAVPDAERRVNDAITAATAAVQKARRTGVILGFSTAAALLAGAAAAWYASCLGGRHRDAAEPRLDWRWPYHS
jgi:MFS family permease